MIKPELESKLYLFQNNLISYIIQLHSCEAQFPILGVFVTIWRLDVMWCGGFCVTEDFLSYSEFIFHPWWQDSVRDCIIISRNILFHLTVSPFSPWSLLIIQRHIFMCSVDFSKGIPWCTPRKMKVYHIRKFIKMTSKSYIYIE